MQEEGKKEQDRDQDAWEAMIAQGDVAYQSAFESLNADTPNGVQSLYAQLAASDREKFALSVAAKEETIAAQREALAAKKETIAAQLKLLAAKNSELAEKEKVLQLQLQLKEMQHQSRPQEIEHQREMKHQSELREIGHQSPWRKRAHQRELNESSREPAEIKHDDDVSDPDLKRSLNTPTPREYRRTPCSSSSRRRSSNSWFSSCSLSLPDCVCHKRPRRREEKRAAPLLSEGQAPRSSSCTIS